MYYKRTVIVKRLHTTYSTILWILDKFVYY